MFRIDKFGIFSVFGSCRIVVLDGFEIHIRLCNRSLLFGSIVGKTALYCNIMFTHFLYLVIGITIYRQCHVGKKIFII